MDKINVNHEGSSIHEIIRITRTEEVEVMLDANHPLHNKLILMNFLLSNDRGAIGLAVISIVNQKMPTNLTISTTIEYIINCPDDVINAIINLFEIDKFFTSEASKARIHLLIEEDEELKSLRSYGDRGKDNPDGHNNEQDLVDNS